MPEISKASKPNKIEKRTPLKNVKPGQVFRFPSITFEQALGDKESAGFYFVVETQPKKTGRVTIISTDGKSVQEKDDDHNVIIHPSKLMVEEAEFV